MSNRIITLMPAQVHQRRRLLPPPPHQAPLLLMQKLLRAPRMQPAHRILVSYVNTFINGTLD